MVGMTPAKLAKYVPMIAFFYSFYEYYQSVGLTGIRADLEAITLTRLKDAARDILVSMGLIIGSEAIPKWLGVKDKYIKMVIKAIAYYVAGKTLATALDLMSVPPGPEEKVATNTIKATVTKAANMYNY